MQTDGAKGVCEYAHMEEAHRLAVKDYIRRLIEATGEDPSNIARKAGLSASTVTRHTNEGGPPPKTGFTYKTVQALEDTWGVPFKPLVGRVVRRKTIPLVGYVGAGDVVFPIDEGPLGSGLEEIEAPPGSAPEWVAVRVRGESMFPAFWEGDVLFYSGDQGFDRETCLYNECIVKVRGGATFVKRIEPGSRAGAYTLTSYNAPPIMDAAVEWAAPVQFRDQRGRINRKFPLRK